MNRKGIVSSVSLTHARVIFPEIDNAVSYELIICPHVGSITPNDTVLVAFWGDSLADGAIIGKVN
jgi:hypothetical protein